jgi:hypothetical protein
MDGLESGLATVKSKTKGMAFGNILFGGAIGAGVDAGTGAAYDYPQLISVAMGEMLQLPPGKDSKDHIAPAATASANSGTAR